MFSKCQDWAHATTWTATQDEGAALPWRIVNLALHPAVGSSDAWHTGGKFLEDCSIAKPFDPETTPSVQGYLPYAYDTDSARQLWDLSNKLVGTSD